jgi:pimeloyl-ACP methyl ester carboxylesterase
MTDPIDTTKARRIPPSYDNRGNPVWKTRMSPPDDTFAMCLMVPDRIIPVIFVPGVMGSNLIAKESKQEKAVRWRLDSPTSVLPWASPTSNAKYRKEYLHPNKMKVDNQGALPEGTVYEAEELRRRGWGEVGAISYGPFLVWLENALNDYDNPQAGERVKLMKDQLQALVGESPLSKDEVGISYRYRFPVWACGYNWLASNAESSETLDKRIDEVIRRYKNVENQKCEKVILVTHSMGGLVARHCSEVRGSRDKIFGIVHGVMPTLGAAAVYRRFKAGSENFSSGFVASAEGSVGASVLGNDAAEMTAVLSAAPGPLQLLPTPEYGDGWLKIRDGGKEHSLPRKGDPCDPYGEIYTVKDKWWSMCEVGLMNPLNEEADPAKRAAQQNKDWEAYADIINTGVKEFHAKIKDAFHTNTHRQRRLVSDWYRASAHGDTKCATVDGPSPGERNQKGVGQDDE